MLYRHLLTGGGEETQGARRAGDGQAQAGEGHLVSMPQCQVEWLPYLLLPVPATCVVYVPVLVSNS